MNRIIERKVLNPQVTLLKVEAPLIARKAQPGQFIILRPVLDGERIPLTVAGYDREAGTVTVIFQVVGASTLRLNQLKEGDMIPDFAGPLGRPTDLAGLKKAAVVAGGVGCAIAYPVAAQLHAQGCQVHAVIGFRNKELVILEEKFRQCADRFVPMSDDGSWGEKGLVTEGLRRLLTAGEAYDRVITIGPLPMMKFVCQLTKEFGVPTLASMNPIMIDGTGMCGCCRLTVGGQMKFACVDGPDFDGHQIDFDEAISRAGMYAEFERHAYEEACNLFKNA